jgi:NAD(P)H-dependent FMN reductase
MKLNIVILYGSVRTNLQGIKAARFIYNTIDALGHNVTLVDPLEHKLPMLDYMYKEYTPDNAPDAIARLGKILDSADSFVVVTGEYNHSVPPALKTCLTIFRKSISSSQAP